MKKWLKYTLGILLTLIVLAAVGGAGYRIGRMQSVALVRKEIQANAPVGQNLPKDNLPPMMGQQDGPRQEQFGFGRGFEQRRGGFPMFPSFFGLIHAFVLGVLIWLGYQVVQRSGWKLIRVQESPVVSQTQSAEVKEEKESE